MDLAEWHLSDEWGLVLWMGMGRGCPDEGEAFLACGKLGPSDQPSSLLLEDLVGFEEALKRKACMGKLLLVSTIDVEGFNAEDQEG